MTLIIGHFGPNNRSFWLKESVILIQIIDHFVKNRSFLYNRSIWPKESVILAQRIGHFCIIGQFGPNNRPFCLESVILKSVILTLIIGHFVQKNRSFWFIRIGHFGPTSVILAQIIGHFEQNRSFTLSSPFKDMCFEINRSV